MNELHLFAGAGGGILGGILLGHTTVCAVEIEPYCRKVLLQRQRDGILPKFPIWDDVKTFDGKPWRGKVDVVCGGFPCTNISIAGEAWGVAIGIEGEESGLWREMARIICEVRPCFVLIENSPALTFRGGVRILEDLAQMGYDARWGIISAEMCGAPHKRERMWILASDPMQKRLERIGEVCPVPKGLWSKRQFEELHEHCSRLALRSGKFSRMVDGVASRMDRGYAIGNGQVPAVAALAWRTLTP